MARLAQAALAAIVDVPCHFILPIAVSRHPCSSAGRSDGQKSR